MTTRVNRWYLTLEEAKRSDLFRLTDITREDSRVKSAIRQASRMIEKALGTWFYPVTATRYFDHPPVDPAVLELDQWLLSVTTFTTENAADTLAATDYFLVHTFQNQSFESPYRCVLMNPDGDYPELEWSDTRIKANAIAGVWGYSDFVEATGATVLNAPLAVGGLSLTVLTGTLETGWMLLIGTEQIFVSSITEGDPNDTVTIVRAQGGTTAAQHVATTAISRYVPPDNIELLCGIITARLFNRRTSAWSDIVGTRESAQSFIKAMPEEARYILEMYLDETHQGASRFVDWGQTLAGRVY